MGHGGGDGILAQCQPPKHARTHTRTHTHYPHISGLGLGGRGGGRNFLQQSTIKMDVFSSCCSKFQVFPYFLVFVST